MSTILPTYSSVQMQPKKPEVDPVQRSIAKPDAFAKAGSLGKPAASAVTRVRPLSFRKSRGRRRKPDPRKVTFY